MTKGAYRQKGLFEFMIPGDKYPSLLQRGGLQEAHSATRTGK